MKKISRILLAFIVCIVFFPIKASFANNLVINTNQLAEISGLAELNELGYSVASAGDVNGDGYEDIIINAMLFHDTNVADGIVYLIYGQEDLFTGNISLDNAVKFTDATIGDRIGDFLSNVGDINHDGYDDIVIGAPTNDIGGNSAGIVYIIYGQAEKFIGTQSLSNFPKFVGDSTSPIVAGWFGHAINSAGDVNGDGFMDIIVGASNYDVTGLTNVGAAYLIYGQAEKFTGTTAASTLPIYIGENASDGTGYGASSAGDVNNDGFDDFIIGAFANNGAGTGAGAVYLIYGQAEKFTGTTMLATVAKFNSEAAGDRNGRYVSPAGDVDNDGYDDFLISSQNNDIAGTDFGAVYLVYGKPEKYTGTVSLVGTPLFTGEATGDLPGISVSFAGDINHDGYDDFLVGAPVNGAGGANAGATYLIYGKAEKYMGANPLSAANINKFIGEAENDKNGFSCYAGDFNGDNYNDLLLSSYVRDEGAVDTGAAYIAYLNVDNDHDGVPGAAGLIAGTDCNDHDATVATNQTYYQDLDNDGLGNLAVTTSVCASVAPAGFVTNSTDINDTDHDNDGSVTGLDCNDDNPTISDNQTYYQDLDADTLGNINQISVLCSYTLPVGYTSNSLDANDVKKDKVLQYQIDSDYYLVLKFNGKKLSLDNLRTNKILDTVSLAKKISYKKNSLKLLTFRNKKLAVIVSKKKAKILTSLVYPNIAQEKLTKKDSEKLIHKNIKPSKTRKHKNYLQLRNKNNKILAKYFVSNKYHLKLN